MTPENFCYWLQGYFELRSEETPLSLTQIKTIEAHLALVFKNVTKPKGVDPTYCTSSSLIQEDGIKLC